MNLYFKTVLISWCIFVIYFNIFAKDIFGDRPIEHPTIALSSLLLSIIPIANIGLAFMCIPVILYYKVKRR